MGVLQKQVVTSRTVQAILAVVFIGLGGWCLFWPGVVEQLGFKPEYQHASATTALLIGCFGAQAVLVGVIIALSEFRPHTFLVFGIIGSLPFFVFNWYFYFVAQMFTDWMLLDFVGNLTILACGVGGFYLKRKEIRESQQTASG